MDGQEHDQDGAVLEQENAIASLPVNVHTRQFKPGLSESEWQTYSRKRLQNPGNHFMDGSSK